MPEPVVEIPNRPAFRAAEVCEIAQIPPYVLKSWEKEFPGLGTAVKPGAPRVYRRADVEQVLRIKHLLFAEGLTLAGAHRKLEGEPKVEEEPLLAPPLAADVRDKVARVKQGMRSLLTFLSGPASPAHRRAGLPPEAGAGLGAPDTESPSPEAGLGAPDKELSHSEVAADLRGRDKEAPASEVDAGLPARDDDASAASSWPPSPAAAEPAADLDEAGESARPLLDGVLETAAPAKAPRRPRRSAKSAGGPTSR